MDFTLDSWGIYKLLDPSCDELNIGKSDRRLKK